MFDQYILLAVIHISVATSSYLDALGLKKSENNKVISKGIWINNNLKEDLYEKNNGDFIFRPNSLDIDNLQQNDFDTFGEDSLQNSPIVSSYIDRSKRSGEYEGEKVSPNSVKCNGDKECILKESNDKSFQSKMMSKLRPASVLNDYPSEVLAIMLKDHKFFTTNVIEKKEQKDDIPQLVLPINKIKQIKNRKTEKPEVKIKYVPSKKSNIGEVIKYNHTDTANSTSKRSVKNDYESKIVKKFEYIEDIDNDTATNNTNKLNRNVFDNEERIWYQNVNPIKTEHNTNMYNVEPQRNKPVNEKGLIKVIAMLTKTFKKIMKQHGEIRKIHTKLSNLNIGVTKNIEDITNKFAEIEQKYSHIVDISNKMKQFETKMDLKEEYFKIKDKEIANNLEEFKNQQKKFLTQQQHFYNIQKLILAQNEQINMKQNLIAKTQSEISHRQHNFARILKKAKQIYIDNKDTNPTKHFSTTSKPYENVATASTETIAVSNNNITTQEPTVTDSIKINLFSIPALEKLVNQDSQILKDKDNQPVDDLVYKYYFNNTFIDNLMKNKVLANIITTVENNEITKNAKAKRDEDLIENTILLPVRKVEGNLNREKRWIRHVQSKSKLKRRLRGKKYLDTEDVKDEKPIRQNNSEMTNREANKLFSVKDANDPFLVMAQSFCNEIGQNTNDQMLHWCIEKALRRLQFLEDKQPASIPNPTVPKSPKASTVPMENLESILPNLPKVQGTINELSPSTELPSTITSSPLTTQSSTKTTTSIYFPDNDELELNLQQYELKPDPEGTVYFDGSVHTSDIVPDSKEDAGVSDLMPDLESNSRQRMDPRTFDIQAMRRRDIRRLAELKKMVFG